MDIAKMIDHTMLKADATKDTILRYCEEAKDNGFASVCVNSSYVALVAKAPAYIPAPLWAFPWAQCPPRQKPLRQNRL